ncbi:MAG TPA: aspartyl/asparaginyl beta-hydroxylase domain-containing protein, partial [Gemmatimonadales bacterium]|nr:aspartyl/asparaginyl beta-hydroxylase domain-containing protein [Gemmatimonadales bacterium]
MVYQASINVGARVIGRIERFITWGSLVGNPAFFDPATFEWVGPLETSWRTIRRELDAVMQYWDSLPNFQDISTDQRTLTDDDRWKTFFLYAYGVKAEGNCRRCPETTQLV